MRETPGRLPVKSVAGLTEIRNQPILIVLGVRQSIFHSIVAVLGCTNPFVSSYS
jgi:hypothetical protein